jgi:pimeloyl-ACP methyl ester carboxylesterase
MPGVSRRLRKLSLTAFGHLMPCYAARVFERAILIPRSPVGGGRPLPLPPGGEVHRVPYGAITLEARVWQPGDPPKASVLLLHGWGSSMSRLAALIEPLVAGGYRVVAHDHPAHGASDGMRTNMIECAAAVLEVDRVLGPFDAAVTHSFGGPTAALAATTGVRFRRLAMLAPPRSIIEQTINAGVMLGVPRHVGERMAKRFARNLGIDWADVETDHMVSQLDAAVLVVHDRDDPIVSHSDGEAIAAAARDGRLVTTERLGHRDILEDQSVVRTVVGFLG